MKRMTRYTNLPRSRRASLVNLTNLRMNGCKRITDAGLSKLRTLTTLDIARCKQITDAGLSRLVNLTTLDIDGCDEITDAAMMSSLTSLNMTQCSGITDAGLAQLVHLTSLNISGCNQITYAGVGHLEHLTELTTGDEYLTEYVPLMCAVKFNNAPGVARWLTDVDVNIRMRDTDNPLFIEVARRRGMTAQMLQVFMNAGADVNAVPCMVRCILHCDVNVVRVLLTAGAGVDAVEEGDDTALHDLCSNVDEEVDDEGARIVALLLAAGAEFH
jgi:hypothetical protein